METGGGRYFIVNATIHNGWEELSDDDKKEFPLREFATHGNINYIGSQMMKDWSSSRYSPSASVCNSYRIFFYGYCIQKFFKLNI